MTPEQWRAVEAIFHEARDRPAGDRNAFLDACGADEVISREVRALLAQAESPSPFLAADDAAAPAVAAPSGDDQRLGHYRLGALIGTGAMGEVYRARDTVLGRDVALKVLSRDLHGGAEWEARFQREARILATLNHPHIAAIYGVVSTDGPPALVLELVEGPTLAAVLGAAGSDTSGRRGLPLAEALRIAGQLADALSAAHAAGIVHRDLKPANITLTTDGLVKVLDFGLAQIGGPSGALLASLPPVKTAGGVVLGTVAYMSPEQARGLAVDQRTDVWAFGCVVFEMLTGQRAFVGDTAADVLAAITSGEPEWSRLPSDTPFGVQALLRRCLDKSASRRPLDVRTAWTLAVAEEVTPSPAPRATEGAAVARRPQRTVAVAIVTTVVAAGLAAVLVARRSPSAATAGVVRATLALQQSIRVSEGAIAVAPNGRTLVYEGRATDEGWRLFRRTLDQQRSEPIAGTEGGHAPFFSPDGRWVGFFAGRQLKKVPLSGGSPEVICDVPAHNGASWSADGSIVFSGAPTYGLMVVAAGGATPTELVPPAAEDGGEELRWPQVLPDSRGVIYAVATGPAPDARIMAFDARTKTRTELVRGAASARLVGRDRLAYAIAGRLYMVRFDLNRLRIVGDPSLVAEGVAEYTDGAPEYGFSATGDLVYVAGRAGGDLNRLALVDLEGRAAPLAAPRDYILYPRTSPDGQRIAYMVVGAKNNLWIYDIPRQLSTRATFGRFHYPIWRPDGSLTVVEGGLGAQRLVERPGDGRDVSRELLAAAYEQAPEAWTPDGRTLFYRLSESDFTWQLWSLDTTTGVRQPYIAEATEAMAMRISPDGRWAAYAGRASDRKQIFVRGLSSEGGRQQVSRDGGSFVVWAPDGRRLYYRGLPRTAGDGLWAVDVQSTAHGLTLSPPRRLFDASGFDPAFDIGADGRQLVMVQSDATPPPQSLELALGVGRSLP